jgi:hypothetical protein
MDCRGFRIFRRPYLLAQLVLENFDAVIINHLRKLIRSILVIFGHNFTFVGIQYQETFA